MVIVMKPGVSQEKIQTLVAQLEHNHGVTVGITNGVGCSILGLVGDTAHIDMDKLSLNDDVERVMRVQEPYKKANRKFHPEDTVADVSGVSIGGDKFAVIAGPCSVESEEQITGVAQDVKEAGASLLRGGAFKPRTSPYSFQGMGTDGLDLLMEAKAATGLPIVSEIMAPRYCGLFEEKVDCFSTVAALYMEQVQIVTTNPDIKSVADLAGKSVSIGDRGSGVWFNAVDVLGAYDIDPDSGISPVYQGFGDSADSLKDKKIDAAFVVAGAPTTAIVDLATSGPVYLVSLDEEHTSALLESSPYYSAYTIPAGTY